MIHLFVLHKYAKFNERIGTVGLESEELETENHFFFFFNIVGK